MSCKYNAPALLNTRTKQKHMVRKIDTDSKLHTKLPRVYVFPETTTQQEKQPLDKRNLPQESKTCINGNSSQGNRLIMLHTPFLLRGLRPRGKKILNFVVTLWTTGNSSLQRHGRPQKFFQRGAKPRGLTKMTYFSARRRRERKFSRFFFGALD